jgi:hypothetical protein
MRSPSVPEDSGNSMYVRSFKLFPLRFTLTTLPEVQDYNAAIHGNVNEIINIFPSTEMSQFYIPMVHIKSVPLHDFPLRLLDELRDQVGFVVPFLRLFCGIQPMRTVTEAGNAALEIVITPIDHYKRRKAFYAGLFKGLKNFATRTAAEAARVTGGGARMGSSVVEATMAAAAGSSFVQPLSRGNQPMNAREGLSRARQELIAGFNIAGEMVRYAFSETGSAATAPAGVLAPVNGFLRALAEASIGIRNSFRPDARTVEETMFKGPSAENAADP